MSDKRRYRRRELVAELAARFPQFDPAEFHQSAKVWPDTYLTFVFRDTTGKEVVRHPCGLWYGLPEQPEGEA